MKSRTVIHPVVDRLLLGYAAAALSAPYVCLFLLFTIGFLQGVADERIGLLALKQFIGAVVSIVGLGTIMLPVSFIGGLPALFIVCYAVMRWGLRSRWWFCALDAFVTISAAYFLLPMFHPAGMRRDLSDPAVLKALLTGWALLAPGGAVAGWIFWRVGVKPTTVVSGEIA